MDIIDIAVNNIEGRILSYLSVGQLTVLQDICSFKIEGGEYKAETFRKKSANIKWDGVKRMFNVQTKTFPIGLLSIIVGTFTNAGFGINIVNQRKAHSINSINLPYSNIEERDYQTQAVIKSLINGSGIVKSATGSGKTSIGARTISAFGKKSVFIVHTRDLLYQTKSSFESIFGKAIGQIGDGIIDLQDITVATVQTLSLVANFKFEKYSYDEEYSDDEILKIDEKAKIQSWARTVGLVIFDEVQRVCSRTAYSARFMFQNADNVFGYSASPWRDDGADLMIEAAFGPRIVDITASELIKSGYLVRPIITIRDLHDNVWTGRTYEQIYKSAIVENVFRNLKVVEDAQFEYENGRNTLVLVTQIKHGEIIEAMLQSIGTPAVFISGKSGMKKRSQVIKDMREGRAPIVIASTIADVGLDVPRLQSIIEAGAGKSSVTALQRVGRIMRPFKGKELCYFKTYHDMAPFINTQIHNKIKIWNTESEFIINRI